MDYDNEDADEYPVLREIYAIRQKLYEETKHMTIEEHVQYVHSQAAPIIAKYGFKVATPEDLARLKSRRQETQ